MENMLAAVCDRYGPPDVVRITQVPRPQVGRKDVLLRVHATNVTAADHRLRSGDVPRGFGFFLRLGVGFRGPRRKILGTQVAGVVEEVGKDVRAFAVGDRVFASCGAKMGGHAEFVTIPEHTAIAKIPKGLDFTTAVSLPFGGATALTFLRDKAHVQKGDRVLINGASGDVGSASVQIAAYLGGVVTGVCSGKNAAMVKRLGAVETIDYEKADFTRGKERYDVILDAVGNCSYRRCKDVLAKNGRLVLAVATLGQMIGAFVHPRRSGRRVISGIAAERKEYLEELARLALAKAVVPPIEKTYHLAQLVEAHRHVDTGRKRGSVVVLVP